MSRSEIFAVVNSALIVAIVIVATVVVISEIITPARDFGSIELFVWYHRVNRRVD